MGKFQITFQGRVYAGVFLDYWSHSRLESCLKHPHTKNNVLGLDIETFPSLPFEKHPEGGLSRFLSGIGCVQICDGTRVLVVQTTGILPDNLRSFLFKHRFVAHNALFELHHLSTQDGLMQPNIDCSMLMYSLYKSATTAERFKMSLQAAVLDLYDEEMEKESQKSNWQDELSQEQIRYAALDAIATKCLYSTLAPMLKELALKQIYDLNKAAQRPLTSMKLNGIGFNVQEHELLISSWTSAKEAAKEKLFKMLPEDINVNSAKQLSDWSKENLGPSQLKGWPKSPKTVHLQFNAKALAYQSGIPFIKDLLEYKKYEKRITTYGTKFLRYINPITQRIHPGFTLCQTDTGRLSCRSPNLQNQPRDGAMRSLFVPEPGNVLVVADYSQIELRCAAELSRDTVMLTAYAEGQDLHRITGASISGKELSQVTKEDRQKAKAVNFGLLFGAGAKTLIDYAKMSYGVDMSFKEATAAVEAFRDTYPEYREWQLQQAANAELELKAVTQLGRIRQLPEKGFFTRSMNTPVQGAAAEVVLTALVLLEKNLNGLAQIINCVHDEIMLEVEKKYSQKACDVLVLSMEEAWQAVFPGASARDLVEANIGDTWEEAK